MTGEQPVKFSTRDWVYICALIIGAATSSMAFMYGTAQSNRTQMQEAIQANRVDVQERMDKLDDRWQTRFAAVATDLKMEIRDVKNGLPPEWLVNRVNRNSDLIEKLTEKLHNQE